MKKIQEQKRMARIDYSRRRRGMAKSSTLRNSLKNRFTLRKQRSEKKPKKSDWEIQKDKEWKKNEKEKKIRENIEKQNYLKKVSREYDEKKRERKEESDRERGFKALQQRERKIY